MIPADEMLRCGLVATRHGIDYRFLAALRETENGADHIAFGVMDPAADTWDAQADEAARTIRHTIGRFARNMVGDWWDDRAACYTDHFVHYFSRGGPGYDGYARVGTPDRPVENDPTGLNAHHYPNLARFYGEMCHTP